MKVVFLRLDCNVPLDSNGEIADVTRLEAACPTLEYLMAQEAKIIVGAHLGRPSRGERLSLIQVAQWFQERFQKQIYFIEPPYEQAIKSCLPILNPRKEMIFLENLRFMKEEEDNDLEFAGKLAQQIDFYINDAFGVLHRKHMSTVGLPSLVPHRGMGFLVEKELKELNYFLNESESPRWVIVGGLKVSDKISLLENLLDVADGLVIGGAMAFTFLRASSVGVGLSLVEEKQIGYAKQFLERASLRKKQILLPEDHKICSDLKTLGNESQLEVVSKIPPEAYAVDIGPKTVKRIQEELALAKSIFWNGPMGFFEKPAAAEGSYEVAHFLAPVLSLHLGGGRGHRILCGEGSSGL